MDSCYVDSFNAPYLVACCCQPSLHVNVLKDQNKNKIKFIQIKKIRLLDAYK